MLYTICAKLHWSLSDDQKFKTIQADDESSAQGGPARASLDCLLVQESFMVLVFLSLEFVSCFGFRI